MKTRHHPTFSRFRAAFACIVTATLASGSAAVGQNLVANGNFSGGNAPDGVSPEGWVVESYYVRQIERAAENGNGFVRIINLNPADVVDISTSIIPLPPEATKLKAHAAVRLNDFKRGAESWKTPAVQLEFFRDGKALEPKLSIESKIAPEDWLGKWTDLESQIIIPRNATGFRVKAGLVYCIGEMDLDDVTVEVVR